MSKSSRKKRKIRNKAVSNVGFNNHQYRKHLEQAPLEPEKEEEEAMSDTKKFEPVKNELDKLKAPLSQPSLGRWLTNAIQSAGSSQTKLTSFLECGNGNVSHWMNGRHIPKKVSIIAMESYFNDKIKSCKTCSKRHVEPVCPLIIEKREREQKEKAKTEQLRVEKEQAIIKKFDNFGNSVKTQLKAKYVTGDPVLEMLTEIRDELVKFNENFN